MPRLIHRLSALVLMAALAAAPAFADPCQPRDPEQVARETINTVLDTMVSRGAEFRNDPEALYQMIEEVLVPEFDVDYVARLVLGRYARQATPEQMRNFTEAFKQMLIQTYGNALFRIERDQIEYLPMHAPDDAEDVTFQTVVTTRRGDEVPVRLAMHLVDCEWKIYNASVDNISYIINYRGQFAAAIRGNGLEAFVQEMERRYLGGQQ